MLDLVLTIPWRPESEGQYVGRASTSLPPALLLLGAESENPIAPSHRNGAFVTLRAAYVFSSEAAVVLEGPVEFNPSTREFRITGRDIEKARGRISAARQGKLIEVGARTAGCMGRVGAAPVSDKFIEAAGPRFAELSASSCGTVWLGNVETVAIEATPPLPSGLAFHGDDLPAAMTLTVEVTTACNFRCGFCYGRHLRQGVLRAAQFGELLNNLPGIEAVEFTGEGEPLLNRDTLSMIRLCKQRGLWVHLTSNGSKMTRARAAEIVGLGVDSFAVSMESTDATEYARFRPGGELGELENAVRLMREAIVERGSRGPTLRLWVSLVKSKLRQIDEFFAFADRHSFDVVEFQTLNSLPAYARFYSDELRGEIATREDIVEALKDRGLSARARNALLDIEGAFHGATCNRFMHTLAPNWQGRVSPCCLLKIPDFADFGDLTQTRLEEVWAREAFQRFRFAMQHGAILESCLGCVNVAGGRPAAQKRANTNI